jgi:hypothetical protein
MNQSKVNQFSILYPKQISAMLECSPNTAKKIHKDIIETYNLPRYVLLHHFYSYFNISQEVKKEQN